jgi:hypothetical protein
MSTDTELHRVLGEISSDVKHVLIRQDNQDNRLNRMHDRLATVEKFQWKLVGLAAAIPTLMTAAGVLYTVLPQ